MKGIISSVAICASALGLAATYPLKVIVNGKAVGHGTFSSTISGHVVTQVLAITVSGPAGTESIDQVQAYKSDGTPTMAEFKVYSSGKEGVVQVKYHGRTAQAEVTSGTHKYSRTLVAPGKLPVKDPSSAWFVFTHPKVGAKVTTNSFDPQSLTWTKQTTTYVKDEKLSIDGHSYMTHELVIISGTDKSVAFLDNHGNIVKALIGGLTIERK